jgi:hypothetical protein
VYLEKINAPKIILKNNLKFHQTPGKLVGNNWFKRVLKICTFGHSGQSNTCYNNLWFAVVVK